MAFLPKRKFAKTAKAKRKIANELSYLPHHADLAKQSHQKNDNACTANGTYPFRDTNLTPSRGLGEAVLPEE